MSETSSDAHSSTDPIGTPDAPAFRKQRAAFVVLLLVYAIFVGFLITWAVQLHRA